MLNQCAMGLDDADEEDLSSAVTDSAHHWQSTNVSDNNGKELGNRSSHLVLVTVEFADDGNESEKLDRCFTKGPDLLSDMSVLDTQQLNLLQPPNTVPFSILGYNPPFENESGTHLSDIENDKISISEAQMLLLKGNIDEENKETIVTLSKIHNSDSFLQNDVVITPLPETVVNTDLTNDIIKESSTVISSHTEFIAQGELTESPSVTRNSKRDEPLDDILAGTGNENLHPLENSAEDMKDGTGWHLEESDVHLPETVCEEGWESDSSSDDQICQVIVDKPVMCRALASLPANFLCIEKTDSSVNGTDVGVFARKDIPKRTQFGPVEGMLSEEKFNIVSSDCTTLELLVEQDCGRMQRLDVSNEHLSNWMRYVRPAKTAKEQNLIVAQHGKLLYYTTTRSIQAREELKVWYSISYASIRGLPLLLSLAPQKSTGSGASGWPCNTCNLRLKHSADCMKCSKDHVKMVKIDKDIFPKYNLRNYQDSMQYEPIHKLGTTHRDRKWCCTHCQRCFNSATLLNLHTLTHAADNLESCTTLTNKSENKCSQCSQDDDKDKIEQENKPLNCRMCSKRFYTNSALVCHIKSHTGGKKFECPICNAVFDKVLDLKTHVHSHSIDGYYSCSQCSKKYVEYKLIRKHIRTFHCGRKHKCINCSKRFPTLDKLRIHELSHSDHRQFLCANCGKQFKRKDKLSEHMRKIHYPEKEKSSSPRQKHPKSFIPKVLGNVSGYTQFVYKCHICIVGFKRRGMLVNHMANRHPDISPDSIPELNLPILKETKDYYCQYCEKIYKSSSKRKAHILKNHPGAQLPLSNKQVSSVKDLSGQQNGTYSLTVGSVSTDPQSCQWCHKQYASKAKLLQHQRIKHEHLLPKTLQKPKKSTTHNSGEKIFSLSDDIEKLTDDSDILQDSINNDVADGDGHSFSEGEFIIDAPTLKRALRGEMMTSECLPESIAELGQLIADSRPDQFFKVIQTSSGITYAQPLEVWDPLSSCQSLSPSDLDSTPFLTPYNGR